MNGKCTVCPADQGTSVVVMIVILLIFIMVLYWIFKRNSNDVPRINGSKAPEKDPGCCSSAFASLTNKACKPHDGHEPVNFMTMVKILISFTQVKSLLIEVYPGAPWPDSYRSATSYLQFLSSNPLSVMMPSCLSADLTMSAYSEMIMSSVAPLVLAPLIWLYYMIRSRCNDDVDARLQLQAVCISTASFAFYLLYPTITVSAGRVLAACDTICTDEAETENCVSYLRADYSIICDDDRHKKYTAVAAVSFVVYAIITPIAIAWKLYSSNKRILQGETQEPSSDARSKSISSFVAGLSFYAKPYTAEFYFWETVDLFRKLFVISIIVFISDGTALQLAIGVVFAVGGLAVQLIYHPYKSTGENVLAAVSQAIIGLALVVGGLLRSHQAEVTAMMASGNVDGFVAGTYMITSGILLYVIAVVVWIGNPLAFLCRTKADTVAKSDDAELSFGAVVTNTEFAAVQETILDNFTINNETGSRNADDSEYLDIENEDSDMDI